MNHRNSWVEEGQYLNPDKRRETSEAEFWYRHGWEACESWYIKINKPVTDQNGCAAHSAVQENTVA